MDILDEDITELLRAWKGGDDEALEDLVPMVYRELRALAAHQLQGERAGFVDPEQATVADDVGGEDGGEPALDGRTKAVGTIRRRAG